MNACIQVTQRAANKDAKRKKGSDLELQDSILSLLRERDDSPAGRITHVQLWCSILRPEIVWQTRQRHYLEYFTFWKIPPGGHAVDEA
ncbi:hypothetical protein TNCV_4361151 [Trichonephila clavipes]|nr:hypothetical protein TNCV_4361151 [Trichonephila clavipes]